MDRLKIFDRALFGKQIGGNGLIVIADTIYLITGVFFGMMELQSLSRFILLENMFVTCILYHNFIVSRGDLKFELNTEKIVYFPTTRYQFLLNKYAKTLIFLVIQLVLTLACLGLGYYGNHGQIEGSRVLVSLLLVYTSILFISGAAILVMHTMPLGIYLSMLLYFPLNILADALEKIVLRRLFLFGNLFITIILFLLLIIFLWLALLWVGEKLYEKIN